MFQVNLVGSDDVVRAFNTMMKKFYQGSEVAEVGPLAPVEALGSVGDVMLAIRRELGNRRTKLSNIEMFESSITDLHGVIDPAHTP